MTKDEWLQIYNVVGAAMDVYNTLGRALEEPLYQEAMELELEERHISFEREKTLRVHYKNHCLKKKYVADFYTNGMIVEFKSVERIHSEHRAQLFNYMRITKTKKGLLINFGEKSLRCERYLYDEKKDDFILLTQQNYTQYI